MSPRQPLWRQVFDSTERTIGRPLEGLVSSRQYVGIALRRQRLRTVMVNAVERPTTAVLHLLNLPARTDVRRLSHQISALTNELRELAAGVDELRMPAPGPARVPAPASKPTTPAAKTGPKSVASNARSNA